MLQHPVFHIRTGCAADVGGIAALIDKAGLVADECDDVYRGLALLCTQPTAPTQIVLVGVDDLTDDELEFFHLLRRACGDLPVYVYGGARYEDRLAAAIRQGATDRFHEHLLQDPILCDCAKSDQRPELSQRASSEPSSFEIDTTQAPLQSAPTPTPSTTGETEDPITGSADEDHGGATEPQDHPTDEHEEEDDEQTIVRVPWLRRDDAPARQRPSGPLRPLDNGNGEPQAQRSAAESSQPLLTDDELRALIGNGDPEQSWADANELDHENDGPEELRS